MEHFRQFLINSKLVNAEMEMTAPGAGVCARINPHRRKLRMLVHVILDYDALHFR